MVSLLARHMTIEGRLKGYDVAKRKTTKPTLPHKSSAMEIGKRQPHTASHYQRYVKAKMVQERRKKNCSLVIRKNCHGHWSVMFGIGPFYSCCQRKNHNSRSWLKCDKKYPLSAPAKYQIAENSQVFFLNIADEIATWFVSTIATDASRNILLDSSGWSLIFVFLSSLLICSIINNP